jgi:MinD superfamily P-loop ATPase
MSSLPCAGEFGKLVTLVTALRLLGLDTGAELVIVDGPPGIGCPVISAASGADLALVVAEPTAAGIHDMERACATGAALRLKALVAINKADIYPEGANQIADYCAQNGIKIVGRIPFDATVLRAMVRGEPVTTYLPGAPASRALMDLWQLIAQCI